MKIDDAIHGISTLITTTIPSGETQGSGFFYEDLSPRDPNKSEQWRKIRRVWIVTNRHVVLPRINGEEVKPDVFTFHLRKAGNNKVAWVPIELKRTELLSRAKFHPDFNIDVCIIEVVGLLTEKVESGEQAIQWFGCSKDNLPGQNKIHPEVASDAVVIGYPRGFYDQLNLYPIVKSGIIASRWGSFFDGKPYFLIDAKLFPGSSGSIVITKPANLMVEEGEVFKSTEKQFAFLGIYSGEPFLQHHPVEFDDFTLIRKAGFNLGIVWYSHLVEEIINNGVQLSA